MLAQNITLYHTNGVWKIQITHHAAKRTVADVEHRLFCNAVKAAGYFARCYHCPLLLAATQKPLTVTPDLPAEWAAVVEEIDALLGAGLPLVAEEVL